MHAEKNVPSRVWAKALKKWKTKGNHHGIDPLYWVMIRLIDPVQVVSGSWYCFGPWYWKRGSWYWKRINLYKENKFIVHNMRVSECKVSELEWILLYEVYLYGKGKGLMIDLNLWCTYEEMMKRDIYIWNVFVFARSVYGVIRSVMRRTSRQTSVWRKRIDLNWISDLMKYAAL